MRYYREKIGILRLDQWGNKKFTGTGSSTYVPLPGDIDDKRSYDFPFLAEIVEGATFEVLCDPNEMRRAEVQKSLLQSTQTAVSRLIERNVREITANCGLFM